MQPFSCISKEIQQPGGCCQKCCGGLQTGVSSRRRLRGASEVSGCGTREVTARDAAANGV